MLDKDMLQLNFSHQTILVVTCVVVCIIRYIGSNIQISGGNKYIQLECAVDVSENGSVPVPSIVFCAMLCAGNPSCVVVHYQSNTSVCLIDTRPANTLLVDTTPVGNSWKSYLRYQYTCGSDWTRVDTSCYHVSSNTMTLFMCWLSYCPSPSKLATIQSDEEMEFALGIINMLPMTDKHLHIRHPEEYNMSTLNWYAEYYTSSAGPWDCNDWNNIACTDLGYCLCEKSALSSGFTQPPGTCLPDM